MDQEITWYNHECQLSWIRWLPNAFVLQPPEFPSNTSIDHTGLDESGNYSWDIRFTKLDALKPTSVFDYYIIIHSYAHICTILLLVFPYILQCHEYYWWNLLVLQQNHYCTTLECCFILFLLQQMNLALLEKIPLVICSSWIIWWAVAEM